MMLSSKILKIGTLTLLLGTTLFAEGSNCKNGVCIVDLNAPSIIKVSNKALDKPSNIEDENLYLEVVEDEQEIHEIIRVENIEEELLLEKTILPDSKYYCESDKRALFDLSSDEYECV